GEHVSDDRVDPCRGQDLFADGTVPSDPGTEQVDRPLSKEATDQRQPVRMHPGRGDPEHPVAGADGGPQHRPTTAREEAERRRPQVDPVDDLRDDRGLSTQEGTTRQSEAPVQSLSDPSERLGVRSRTEDSVDEPGRTRPDRSEVVDVDADDVLSDLLPASELG